MPDETPFEPASGTPTTDSGQHLLSVSDFESGGVPQGDDGAIASSPSQAPVSQEVQALGIRDVLAQLGYQAPANITDDYSALAHLAAEARQTAQYRQQLQQQDAYRQLGIQLAPHAPQLQQFIQQQQAPAAPKTWQPPQFDQRWANLVQRDEATGVYIGKPGTPMEVVHAVNTWADWQEKFRMDPMSILQPALDDVRRQAVEEAKREIQSSLQMSQTQSAVQTIVSQISPWFYAKDATGQPVRDPYTGQPQPTPLGVQYLNVIRNLEQRGVTNPQYKDELARTILAAQISQATESQTVQQVTQQRQAQASRGNVQNRNPLLALGEQERRQTPHSLEPDPLKTLSVAERLRAKFRENGVTDDSFAMA